jgi:uncharacterized protein (TIRG00374 family)
VTQQKRTQVLSWLINLVGVLAFGLVLYFGGIEAWQHIIYGDWRYVLAAFAVTLLWNLTAAYRWSLIANQVVEPPEPIAYRYYFTFQMIGSLIGQVMPITLGMLGGRPVALSLSRGVSLKLSVVSVFLDKLFDLALAMLLAIPVGLYLVGWIERPLAFGLMAAVVVLAALIMAWRYKTIVQLSARAGVHLAKPLALVPFVGRRLARRLPRQMDRLASAGFVSNWLAVKAFLLTLFMYSLLAARLVFISRALRLDIPWYLLLMGVGITQLALVFSVTPGSLGFLEGGWAAVLGLSGLSLEDISVFLIGRRAYVLVFTLINTLLAFTWIRESPARLFRSVIDASRRPDKAADGDSQPPEKTDETEGVLPASRPPS